MQVDAAGRFQKDVKTHTATFPPLKQSGGMRTLNGDAVVRGERRTVKRTVSKVGLGHKDGHSREEALPESLVRLGDALLNKSFHWK